ncbi:MAG: MBL fold metallo-hydrolase [Peptococcaceae bacterium]|nr:MBL fold metallo-hydrolase [Peptococcaceae bacterium]
MTETTRTGGCCVTHPGGVVELCLWSVIGGRRIMPCRAYWVEGLLVDTCHARGKRAFAAWAASRLISGAVLTHHHEDHAGNAALLNSRGIPVLAHPAAAALMDRPLPIFERVVWGAPEPAATKPAPACIEAGKRRLKVVETPGHTPDHIALLEENEGWLFAGDLYLADRLVYLHRDEDLGLMLASLEKVLRLDFSVLFCAHRGRVADGRMMLAAKRNFLLELVERVHDLSRAGYGEKEITGLVLGREGLLTWVSRGLFSKRRLVHRILHPGSAG